MAAPRRNHCARAFRTGWGMVGRLLSHRGHHATGASRGLNTSRSPAMRPLMPAAIVNGAVLNFAEGPSV